MKLHKTVWKTGVSGLLIGVINGLFGAGGGMLAVPMLKSLGFTQKQAHAGSVALILPLCCISAGLYLYNGNATIDLHLGILCLFGLAGAGIGTWIMKKIDPNWLRRIFAVFLIWSGARMLFF